LTSAAVGLQRPHGVWRPSRAEQEGADTVTVTATVTVTVNNGIDGDQLTQTIQPDAAVGTVSSPNTTDGSCRICADTCRTPHRCATPWSIPCR
jgi:hypothetical protein